MSIRSAARADLNALASIENEAFDANSFVMSRTNLLYHINNNPIFVYEVDGVVAGYILMFLRKNSWRARVYSLAVSEAFRGHGIAKKLLKHTALKAKEADKTALRLEVRADNHIAIKAYENFGFHYDHKICSYYPDGTDALVLELSL